MLFPRLCYIIWKTLYLYSVKYAMSHFREHDGQVYVHKQFLNVSGYDRNVQGKRYHVAGLLDCRSFDQYRFCGSDHLDLSKFLTEMSWRSI